MKQAHWGGLGWKRDLGVRLRNLRPFDHGESWEQTGREGDDVG